MFAIAEGEARIAIFGADFPARHKFAGPLAKGSCVGVRGAYVDGDSSTGRGARCLCLVGGHAAVEIADDRLQPQQFLQQGDLPLFIRDEEGGLHIFTLQHMPGGHHDELACCRHSSGAIDQAFGQYLPAIIAFVDKVGDDIVPPLLPSCADRWGDVMIIEGQHPILGLHEFDQ